MTIILDVTDLDRAAIVSVLNAATARNTGPEYPVWKNAVRNAARPWCAKVRNMTGLLKKKSKIKNKKDKKHSNAHKEMVL